MHRTTWLAAAVLLALAAPAWTDERKDSKDSKDSKDATRMVGTWTVMAEEKDGKKQTADEVRDKHVKITRDTITCTDKADKTDMACRYEVDTSKTPWQITANCTEGEYKGKTLKGIVLLDGDNLYLAFAKPDKEAPTDFKTKADQFSVALKRSDKEKP
jgi:uncharacterized protein (TIGR03067 family)